jgi:tRNA pseudouridine55 synthase
MSGVDGLWTKQSGLPSLEILKAGAVLPVHKPRTWTSFDVVRRVRNRLKGAKIGHAGTLDPLADGLLILCIGAKTKEIDRWMGGVKTYEASVVLGAVTESYDLETPVQSSGVNFDLEPKTILEGLGTMVGFIQQKPPAHSAIKVDGVRSYTRARQGKSLEMQARTVHIEAIDLLGWNKPQMNLRIRCAKGTYIRSLAHDLGAYWGCGAYLEGLRRTGIGSITLDQAFQLEDFDAFLQIDSPPDHARR